MARKDAVKSRRNGSCGWHLVKPVRLLDDKHHALRGVELARRDVEDVARKELIEELAARLRHPDKSDMAKQAPS